MMRENKEQYYPKNVTLSDVGFHVEAIWLIDTWGGLPGVPLVRFSWFVEKIKNKDKFRNSVNKRHQSDFQPQKEDL